MKQTRLIMGMPITVEIADAAAEEKIFAAVFDYFTAVDERFSTYKPGSEISRINRGELGEQDISQDMRIIFMLAEDTKRHTGGFFDIRKPDGSIDPSGIVKGWAIFNASKIIEGGGLKNYYIEAGGDIETGGVNAQGNPWSIGIKNPFRQEEIVKTVYLPTASQEIDRGNRVHGTNQTHSATMAGIATSGTYIRGEHIYNPKTGAAANEIASITVIGPNIYEADRFATAAFAMGPQSIRFIERFPGLEGYMIDKGGTATMTTGFEAFTRMPNAFH